MKADSEAKSLNYKEMCQDLENGEYSSYTAFMEEVRNLLRHRDLTNRHHTLLMNKARKYFNLSCDED